MARSVDVMEHRGSVLKSALGGKCPRCGEGRLYSGFLTLAPSCNNCGLDYDFADSGDGPAVFVIMIVGFLATGGVLWTEFALAPPVWMHVVLWGPLTVLLSLAFLYWLKGGLIAQQYKTSAEQAQIAGLPQAGTDLSRSAGEGLVAGLEEEFQDQPEDKPEDRH